MSVTLSLLWRVQVFVSLPFHLAITMLGVLWGPQQALRLSMLIVWHNDMQVILATWNATAKPFNYGQDMPHHIFTVCTFYMCMVYILIPH